MFLHAMIAFICSLVTISYSLPDIYCNPFFGTITKLVNDSYFIVDGSANFWLARDNEEVRRESSLGKVVDFRTGGGARIGQSKTINGYFTTFDLTFMVNFDGKCEALREQIYGLKFTKSDLTVYTCYSNLVWSDVSWMNTLNMGHEFLNKANNLISINQTINAILNFKMKGMLVFQGSNLTYVHCDRTKGWQLYVGNPIEFVPPYTINYGEIFGGLVDNDRQILYLFPAVISSTRAYIRKTFHNCSFTFKTGKDTKIRLNCKRQTYQDLCESQAFLRKYKLVLAIVGAVVLIFLLSICFGLYFCYKNRRNDSPELRTLAEDKVSVNVSKNVSETSKLGSPPKPILARERTFGQLKPTLKRIRTVDFLNR